MHNLQRAINRINTAYDARINTASERLATVQADLDNLIAEKELRLQAVKEFIQAENEKVRIDAIVANVPPELV